MSIIRIAGGSGPGLDIAAENPRAAENVRRVSNKDSADGNNIHVLPDFRNQGQVNANNVSSGQSREDENDLFESVMEELRQELKMDERQVEFSFDQDLRQMVVKVTDKNNGSVVRQIPEEYVLRMIEKFQISGKIEGLLINDKV